MKKWLLIIVLVFNTAVFAGNMAGNEAESEKIAARNNEVRLEYILNKDKVFYAGEQVKGADMRTFKILNEYYAKDKNVVYYLGAKLGTTDTASFEVLNAGYARDKSSFYVNGLKLGEVDLNTVKF